MEVFQPGEDYGKPRQHTILVCMNPQNRSFERCDPAQSAAVYQACLSRVAMMGQSQNILVATSGCVLGCKQDGATVTLLSKASSQHPESVQFFRSVRVEAVDRLLEQLLQD